MALHTPEFRDAAVTPFAEEALLRAGKALALTGLDAMRDPAFLEAARADFAANLGRRPPQGLRGRWAAKNQGREAGTIPSSRPSSFGSQAR